MKGYDAMVRIAVCDDEKQIRQNLICIIKKQIYDAEIFEFSSGKELIDSTTEFDITFLDIAMDELSGIEVAKQIRMKQEQKELSKGIIIFVTGYREYMEDAFDVNAYHYLVKPIDEDKMVDVLGRAMKDVTVKEMLEKQYVILKSSGLQKRVLIKDIYYVESNNKKVIIHTADGNIEMYGKMDEFESELGSKFYRCHRCYLVNMEKISAYSTDTIHVTNGDILILAQKKYSEFIKAYMRYAKAGGVVNV